MINVDRFWINCVSILLRFNFALLHLPSWHVETAISRHITCDHGSIWLAVVNDEARHLTVWMMGRISVHDVDYRAFHHFRGFARHIQVIWMRLQIKLSHLWKLRHIVWIVDSTGSIHATGCFFAWLLNNYLLGIVVSISDDLTSKWQWLVTVIFYKIVIVWFILKLIFLILSVVKVLNIELLDNCLILWPLHFSSICNSVENDVFTLLEADLMWVFDNIVNDFKQL